MMVMTFDAPFFHSSWFVPVLIWTIIWKGFALWRAGNLRQKWWFLALLIVNTFGVLEVFYIFVFSRQKKDDQDTTLPL